MFIKEMHQMSPRLQSRIERPKRLGRPPDPAKVEAILDTGWAMLLARGYEATSIEAVAAEAGVSRVTVYKHFPGKGALFREAVLRATRRIEAEQVVQDRAALAGAPLAARLERFGIALMTLPCLADRSRLLRRAVGRASPAPGRRAGLLRARACAHAAQPRGDPGRCGGA